MSEKLKIVEVVWLDSVILDSGEWMPTDQIQMDEGQLLHKTVGYIVAESETAICIAQSINWQEDGHKGTRMAGGMLIPQRAVVSQSILREPQ